LCCQNGIPDRLAGTKEAYPCQNGAPDLPAGTKKVNPCQNGVPDRLAGTGKVNPCPNEVSNKHCRPISVLDGPNLLQKVSYDLVYL